MSHITERLAAAFARYTALTFPHQTLASSSSAGAAVVKLVVTVLSTAEDFPQIETDESYTLNVTAAGAASLAAKTVFGGETR